MPSEIKQFGAQPPRRNWGRLVLTISIGAFLALAIVIAALVSFWRADDQRTFTEIVARLNAIRAAGQPVSVSDLAQLFPDPPQQRDASLLWKPGLDLLSIPEVISDVPLFGDTSLPRGSKLPSPLESGARNLIDQNQRALNSIPWGRLDGAWIGSGFTNGVTRLKTAPLEAMGSLVKILCSKAVLDAEAQRPTEATESLQQAYLIIRTLRADTILHCLVQHRWQELVCQTVERVINRTRVAEPELISLFALLGPSDTSAAKQMLIVERCVEVSMAEILRSNATQLTTGIVSPPRRLLRAYQGRLLFHETDLLQCLVQSERCLVAMGSPLSNALPALFDFERTTRLDQSKLRVLLLDVFKKNRISLMSVQLPVATQLLLPQAVMVARARGAVTALAIERWRLAHDGQLPDSLERLVPSIMPQVPVDPFDDRPLRYKKLPNGYIVYSVGPDFVDDGGKERAASQSESAHGDITFTVER